MGYSLEYLLAIYVSEPDDSTKRGKGAKLLVSFLLETYGEASTSNLSDNAIQKFYFKHASSLSNPMFKDRRDFFWMLYEYEYAGYDWGIVLEELRGEIGKE